MSAEIERAIAEVLAGIEEDCLPKKPALILPSRASGNRIVPGSPMLLARALGEKAKGISC
jgi:hypothetical protein